MSLFTKLELCQIIFGRLDKSLCDKPIKNGPFVRLQIRVGSLQQIAKDRNFQVREIIMRHDAGPFLKPDSQFRFQVKAKSGDARSAEILLRRVWPERKGRTFEFELPAIDAAADVPKALGAVIAAMAAGEIAPDEASAIASVLESKRKAIETEEFDRRGHSSYLVAMMIGSRFSVLTQWDPWIALYKKGLREYGLESFCASIRSINTPPDVENLLGGKEEVVFPRLRDAALRCVEEDGADVICMGSTTMHQAVPYLQQLLPVPVINPGPLSYKLAELALGLSLTHSRRAYPKPREPRLDLLGAMLDGAASAAGAS